MGQRGRRKTKPPVDVTNIDPSKYKLFEDNLFIAYKIAKKFYPKPLLFEDAIQIAQEGLWKACLDFDESKGYAFTSLAYRTVSNTLIKSATKESNQESECFISLDAEIYSKEHDDSVSFGELIVNKETDVSHKVEDEFNVEELMELLDNVLSSKSEEEKKLFIYLKEGRSVAEIKEDLGYTRVGISNFRKQLAKELLEIGYSNEDLEDRR